MVWHSIEKFGISSSSTMTSAGLWVMLYSTTNLMLSAFLLSPCPSCWGSEKGRKGAEFMNYFTSNAVSRLMAKKYNKFTQILKLKKLVAGLLQIPEGKHPRVYIRQANFYSQTYAEPGVDPLQI